MILKTIFVVFVLLVGISAMIVSGRISEDEGMMSKKDTKEDTY